MKRSIILIGWLLISWFVRLPSRVNFLIAILTIMASFILRLTGVEGFALRLMTYSYGFAVIGVVIYLREIYKDERSEK